MVTRRLRLRRKADQTKVCKLCVSILLAVGVLVGPQVWDRVIALASAFATPQKALTQSKIPRGGM